MTTKGEWIEFDGSDEQIAEIINSKNGFIVDSQWSIFNEPNKLQISFDDRTNIDWLKQNFKDYNVTKYWIIPDDPLREMKLRHDATGQPVWVRAKPGVGVYLPPSRYLTTNVYGVFVTTTPDWNIPNAEYSFTAFEE